VKPTVRQLQLLKIIQEYITEYGYPPSRRELAIRLEVSSTNTIQGMLAILRMHGLIHYDRSIARSISVTPTGKELLA
jgi:repressor LexA